MNPEVLIGCINKKCKQLLNNSFNLELQNKNTKFIHYVIDGTSYAVNKQERVKVFSWFNDFWLFFKITFEKNEEQINTIISLSVFQGDISDNIKNQLFRAEWDDYNNPDERRAQPHWHIVSSQVIGNIFEDYTDV